MLYFEQWKDYSSPASSNGVARRPSLFHAEDAKTMEAEVQKAEPDGLTVLAGRVQNRDNQIDERISNIVIYLGIVPNMDGFRFAVEGARLAYRNPRYMKNVTKELYPTIGMQCGSTATRVERSLRSAIEQSWKYGKMERLNVLYQMNVIEKNEKPTNSAFLSFIAEKVKSEFGSYSVEIEK